MRHGATEGNLRRPYTLQGREPDSELAPAGVAQARAAAAVLQPLGIQHVYASPLRRARVTADEIAGRLGLNVQVMDGLIEVDVGQWACLTWDEVARRWPAEFQAFQTH